MTTVQDVHAAMDSFQAFAERQQKNTQLRDDIRRQRDTMERVIASLKEAEFYCLHSGFIAQEGVELGGIRDAIQRRLDHLPSA